METASGSGAGCRAIKINSVRRGEVEGGGVVISKAGA